MSCAVGGDHEAVGREVAGLVIPMTALPPETIITLSLCEDHIWPTVVDDEGMLLPGVYSGKIYTEVPDDT